VIPVLVHKIEHLTSKWNKSENPTQSAIHLTSGRNMEDTLHNPVTRREEVWKTYPWVCWSGRNMVSPVTQ
jgi:hypothetical protein